jgi:hypothetical protein
MERWVDRGDGVLELRNENGEVIATQKTKTPKEGPIHRSGRPPGRPVVTEPETHHFVLDDRGRKVWVPKGTNPDTLPRTIWPFSEVTADNILQKITEGATLEKIGLMEGFPPVATIYRWMREQPAFKREMAEAKKMRAEWRADQAMKIADNEVIRESEVPGQRLRADLYKWGAEMDDRATFGKQTTVKGDSSNPIVFKVMTGVPAPLDAGDSPEFTADGRLISKSESSE